MRPIFRKCSTSFFEIRAAVRLAKRCNLAVKYFVLHIDDTPVLLLLCSIAVCNYRTVETDVGSRDQRNQKRQSHSYYYIVQNKLLSTLINLKISVDGFPGKDSRLWLVNQVCCSFKNSISILVTKAWPLLFRFPGYWTEEGFGWT